jgi:LacI family transcriptional regulator
MLRECFADGLLIDYPAEIPPTMKRLLTQSRLPAIWLNTKRPEDCVHPDDVSAGRLATEHLIQLGHRRIAYLDYSCSYTDPGRFLPAPSAHYCTSDRLDGYLQAMRKANLPPRLIASERTIPRNQRVEYSRRWLALPDRPTAVVAWSVSAALPVLHAATLMGLRVPRDLSLIACHDRVPDEMGVSLTTALIPLAETGAAAVRMLMEKIEHPARKLAVCVLPVRLDLGETTAPPSLQDMSMMS